MIDEEMTPDFLRRKAQEQGHTMTEWEEIPQKEFANPDSPCILTDLGDEFDLRCVCQDCGAEILYGYFKEWFDGRSVLVGHDYVPEIGGTAHTTHCPTYFGHYGTLFPFLPMPRKSTLNKTKKGH